MNNLKTIEQLRGLKVGHVGLGSRGGVTGSVKHQVHDGDTINVRALGNFGIRFLGVDAPEISFMLPGETVFTGMANPKWEQFLTNPFSDNLTPFDPLLDPELRDYLESKIGPDAAKNQHVHATETEDALEKIVVKDLEILDKTIDNFQFFLAFAYEVMDAYGRLLCFINRDQPKEDEPEPRPKSYNERLLQQGNVSPYFIWPNINPYRKRKTIASAVIKPGTAKDEADGDATLKAARESVTRARQEKKGIFNSQNPLRLEPFEIRFLARREPPSRWLIDLSKNEDKLINPQRYYTIQNTEDRLYISEEYVPLFEKVGWQKQH